MLKKSILFLLIITASGLLAQSQELKDKYNNARTLSDQGDYQKALTAFSEVVTICKTSKDIICPDAYYGEGYVKLMLGEYKESIMDFNEAKKLNKDAAYVYSALGYSYMMLQNYKEAVDNYSDAIKLNQTDHASYFSRGYSYLMLKKYRQAIKDLDKAIELAGKDATDSYYEARAQAKQLSNDYSGASDDRAKAGEIRHNKKGK
jgi:tetratricopeptide (TPR) repeat protein